MGLESETHFAMGAHAINEAVGAVFEEETIFCINHYIGKEMAPNRSARARASYYDKAGGLRDMLQNHLVQLLCLVAMKPPFDLSQRDIKAFEAGER